MKLHDVLSEAVEKTRMRKIEKALKGKRISAFGGKPGHWGKSDKSVTYTIDKAEFYLAKDGKHASLDIYLRGYDHAEKPGMIYTDPTFEAELQQLVKDEVDGVELGYSEQGRQGQDYVNLDVNFETDIKESLTEVKKPQNKPNEDQTKLLAAFLAISNLGHVDSKITVKDGIASFKVFSRPESIDLNKPEKYTQEARSLLHLVPTAFIPDAEDVNSEYKEWIKDVKRMTWDTVKKNWNDMSQFVDAMIKASGPNDADIYAGEPVRPRK